MQANLGLIFETLTKEAGFRLTTPSGNSTDVIFEDSPSAIYVGQTTSAIIFQASENIKATSFMSDGNVVIYFNKNTNVPQAFSLKFKDTTITKINDNQIKININGLIVYVDLKDCYIVNNDTNSISIMMGDSDATIEFSTQLSVISSLSNVSIQSVDDSRMVVPVSKRIPEFIISIYDDSRGNYPRPLRFGVPVISTVSSVPQSGETLYQEDKDLLELGIGTKSRKMYFWVISDQLIDESLREQLSLEIDLPSGSDTVEQTASLQLEYVETVDTNDIFTCVYDFHKEDTVNYVDGFAYLSIKMPLRIQRNLPLTFQVSSDGVAYENTGSFESVFESSGGVDEFVGDIDLLSFETNAVQLNNAQDYQAKNGKKKKDNQKPKS